MKRALERLEKASVEQQQAIRSLLERHRRGEEGLPLQELPQAMGAVPETVRHTRDLVGVSINLYKALTPNSLPL